MASPYTLQPFAACSIRKIKWQLLQLFRSPLIDQLIGNLMIPEIIRFWELK